MRGFRDNVDGFYDVGNQLPQYLSATAQENLDAGTAHRDTLTDQPAIDEHAAAVRENFTDALGGLPERRCDLEWQTTGTIDRTDHTIETIVFQSLPDFYVTTNLYRPVDAETPTPAVLFFCGHSDDGKAAGRYQETCVHLARNGFTVLAVDPVGQGERHQFYDPDAGTVRRRNLHEHTYLAHQCALVGQNLARYFVWDGIRAFDHLAARTDVDETRIGATGNSGGGMQTAYQMLADDRLAAAAPCCFITSKEDYIKTGQAQDGEQIIWRAMERGPRYDDFLATFAPKPVRIGASQSDFLCIEGAHRTYERAKRIYDVFDAGEAIDLTVSPTTHGLDPVLQQGVVNWFREHLQDRPPVETLDRPDTLDPNDLRCLPDGEVLAAYPDARTVTDFIRGAIDEPATGRESAVADAENGDSTTDSTELQATIRDRFDLDRDSPDLFPRTIEVVDEDGLRWEKVFFRSEPNIITTGILARDSNASSTDVEPVVVLLPHGTDDLADWSADIATIAHTHGAVFVFDPRGVGAVQSRDVNTPHANGGTYYDYHGTEYKLNADALMCGTSLAAHRTFDILRAATYLTDRWPGSDLCIVGAGRGAILALFAAVAESSFQSVLVEDIPSFRERATAADHEIDHGLKMHDVVNSLDTQHLLAALADREPATAPFSNGIPTEALTR